MNEYKRSTIPSVAATLLGMSNHPAPALVMSDSERASLRALARAGTTQQRLAVRARIVLRAGDGAVNDRIAAELGVDKMTVLLGRRRFGAARVAGRRDTHGHAVVKRGVLFRPGCFRRRPSPVR